MKIKQQSADFTEEQIIAFAQFLGWQDKVVERNEEGVATLNEEGNALMIDNPYTYEMFLADRYNALPLADLKAFNLAQIKAEKAAELLVAEEQVEDMVKDLVTVTIE